MIKLIILDLDETLIHAREQTLEREADLQTELYYIYLRPYAIDLLEFCCQYFLVGVWTTAGKEFAEIVVSQLFPQDYSLQFIYTRERCTRAYDPELMEPYYVKNLAKLKRKGYRLSEIIMIDDTPRKLERNYGNLVRIKEWLGDDHDQELLRLRAYLTDLKSVEDVRLIEKRGWQNRYQF